MAKAFSWSYSKYKNFFTCPKRHYEVDLQKNFTETSEQLTWGNEVHAALATAVATKVALPPSMHDYQRWVDEAARAESRGAKVLVEQKYAITKDFRPTKWFAGDVWYRGICDILILDGPFALARDYKTGRMDNAIDSRQLMLMSQCIFCHHPQVRRAKTEFIWLKEDCTSPETFDRNTIMQHWPPVLAGVKQMQHAADTMTYPPQPGRLCARHCPVVSCPFHGKRQ